MTASWLFWSWGFLVYLLFGSPALAEDDKSTLRPTLTTDLPYNPDWTAGTWGSWSGWSPCSRTCGRGVSTQTRKCIDDSRSLRHVRHRRMRSRSENGQCLGIYKRFHLCELRPCPVETNLRKEACEAFNDKPFRGRFYKWEPHFAEADDCALNCRPQGHKFYVTLASQVEDGTPCSYDELVTGRVCVAGQCKSIGCDGILGSENLLDQCGVCGGDGSTCQVFSGYYTKPTMPIGYNLIVKIPAGARNINVTELRPSKNYLSLRTEDGQFVINGKWKVLLSGEYRAAGTVFVYTNEPYGRKRESIFAAGPTNVSLHLLLVYHQYNPGVMYSFAVPVKADNATAVKRSSWEEVPWHQNSVNTFKKPHQKRVHLDRENKKPREKKGLKKRKSKGRRHRPSNVLNDVAGDQSFTDHYMWRITGYTDCSRTCGGGTSQTMVACYKQETFTVVSESFCDVNRKPPLRTIPCKSEPCPMSRWLEGPWSNCSVACGEGQQTRKVSCVLTTLSSQVTVDDAQCRGQERPLSSRICKSSQCSDGWKVEEWGKCSAECGKGLRKRKVVCAKDECLESKPNEEEVCDMGNCRSIWLSSSWQDVNCTNPCQPKEGLQTRKVVCIHGMRRTKDDFCEAKSQPPSSRPCHYKELCTGKWFTSSWSKCSVPCGVGNRTRDVVCMTFAKGHWHSALPINCNSKRKPIVTEECHSAACEDEWYTTDWSQCSKSCDGGTQTRDVMCLSMELTTSQKCPEHLRPADSQSCNTLACPELGQKDSGCGDKLNNCPLVVQARLCRYDYYRNICCHSCHVHQSKNGDVKESNKPI